MNNTKKLLYIALCDLWEKGEIGIQNKIFGQIKSLEKRYDTYLCTLRNMILCTIHNGEITEKRVLLSYEDIYCFIEQFVREQNIKIIYLRYLKANLYLIRFLKQMKRNKVGVIIEFPTFPYDLEGVGRVEFTEDRYYRNSLKKFVKKSVNYNGLTSIMGIPSIAIQNGVDLERISLRKEKTQGDGVTFIAVATMNFWHGYDRLIKGISNYYMKHSKGDKVYLKLVGEGKEIPRYRDLIKLYHMEKYIILEGMRCGEELEELFNQSDIAIGPLGAYRKNMYEDSSLKAKEYCARGLPIVLATKDLAFPKECNFIFRVPNDDSDIEVEGILSFFKVWKKTGSAGEIRDYAKEHLTWDVTLNQVFGNLEQG